MKTIGIIVVLVSVLALVIPRPACSGYEELSVEIIGRNWSDVNFKIYRLEDGKKQLIAVAPDIQAFEDEVGFYIHLTYDGISYSEEPVGFIKTNYDLSKGVDRRVLRRKNWSAHDKDGEYLGWGRHTGKRNLSLGMESAIWLIIEGDAGRE